jgi:LytS/YehU family sensor histidine kinase
MEYLIDFITQTMVCFSCISYFYFSDSIKTKERLSAAQRAQSEMQLKLLQQKVDPHFLFNNLNVLSSLIEKNPKIANEFLVKLAELYRYILHTQNTEIVSIKDELGFAENYVYLLNQRFGQAYNFDWEVPTAKINGQMIVPAALQGLLENVVKHNAGDQKEPLRVRIKLDEDFLLVENKIRAKPQTRQTSGTGLENLKARYAFLTEQIVEIRRSPDDFSVKIPLLRLKR